MLLLLEETRGSVGAEPAGCMRVRVSALLTALEPASGGSPSVASVPEHSNMTQSRTAEAAEAFAKKGEGRPAQTGRAQARAAKAQAKARHQRLKELEKKVAKQDQACC